MTVRGSSRMLAGFSLVELYIVVALLGILMAIAVPTWQEHLRSARRDNALLTLAMIEARQARYLLENRRYAGQTELYSPRPNGLGLSAQAGAYYNFAIQPDPTGYLAVATTRADTPQRRDVLCYQLMLDATGLRRSMTQQGADSTERCWRD